MPVPRSRLIRLVFLCALAAAAALPAAGLAADRMYVGIQDDPSLRWRDDRAAMLDRAAGANVTMVRTTVYWSRVSPTRPKAATNPFDPSYRLDDLDEMIRGAQQRGISVMLTIWGTPGWANGGKGENRAPTRAADLTNFARALASRYSGRYPGFPYVGHYSVWNEPNLEQFLAPTFNAQGKAVSPHAYAIIYRAAYAGLKAGNPKALVAIGETSPRGRDKLSPSPGKLQNTLSPGNFAKLLAAEKPALKFDAWAHHPYSTLGQGPLQKVRFPNVNLTQIPQFETSLKTWFKKKTTIPIWITEYGFETKPGEPKGVTAAQQASYMKTAFDIAKKDPAIQMFIWFILRDDTTSLWQSGLLNRDSSQKPGYAIFSDLAKTTDVNSPVVVVKDHTPTPTIRVPVLQLAYHVGVGQTVGATIRAFKNGKDLIGVSQPTAVIGLDGWVTFQAPIPDAKKNRFYRVELQINDAKGGTLNRVVTVTIAP